MTFSLAHYQFEIPPHLIAQEAVRPHHKARMMVINRETGELEAESVFENLPGFIWDSHVLFFNNSKVLPSRLTLRDFATEKDGKKVPRNKWEIFFLSKKDENTFEALVQPGNIFKIWTKVLAFWQTFFVREITDSWRILELLDGDIFDVLKRFWSLPLPPYITYEKEKESDYQSVFAEKEGSVAAPTASLHFSKELLESLTCKKEYITLHVWLWTFSWIKTEDIREFQIHEEYVEIEHSVFEKITDMKMSWKKIIAVGTTVCRTLESLPSVWKGLSIVQKKSFSLETQQYWNECAKEREETHWIGSLEIQGSTIRFGTSIYITPGFDFLIIDELITNFHLGGSSLLVLVSAFLWYTATMDIYKKAVAWLYRFYSFGDGMYIRIKK